MVLGWNENGSLFAPLDPLDPLESAVLLVGWNTNPVVGSLVSVGWNVNPPLFVVEPSLFVVVLVGAVENVSIPNVHPVPVLFVVLFSDSFDSFDSFEFVASLLVSPVTPNVIPFIPFDPLELLVVDVSLDIPKVIPSDPLEWLLVDVIPNVNPLDPLDPLDVLDVFVSSAFDDEVIPNVNGDGSVFSVLHEPLLSLLTPNVNPLDPLDPLDDALVSCLDGELLELLLSSISTSPLDARDSELWLVGLEMLAVSLSLFLDS